MPSASQPSMNLDQRDVSLGDRLKKPVFLEKFLVLRVAHKRQVRVQHEGKVALQETWSWASSSKSWAFNVGPRRCHVTAPAEGVGSVSSRGTVFTSP
jgi:hypothetical protein